MRKITVIIFILFLNSTVFAQVESGRPDVDLNFFYKLSDLKHAFYFGERCLAEDSSENKKIFKSPLLEKVSTDIIKKNCTDFFSIPASESYIGKDVYLTCENWGWSANAQSKPQD